MRGLYPALCAALLTAAPGSAAIPSCYAMKKMEVAPPQLSRELFVLIDQTTPMDERLKAAVRDTVGPLLAPGTAFTIATFSAFAQGRYLSPLAGGRLEKTVGGAIRDDISVRKLEELDACLARQMAFGRRAAARAIKMAVDGQSNALAHSDVISSLTDLSRSVAASHARNRTVIVVSDMLENSGITSFYNHGALRRIDPRKELRLVADKDFLGDFRGAHVYVIGAGALPGANSYHDPESVRAIERFWDGWFRSSNATLEDFGKPMPNIPIR